MALIQKCAHQPNLCNLLSDCSLIWFVATLRNDVDSNRTDIIRLDTRTTNLELVVQSQAVTLARIDENIKGIREYLERGN